jgi:hypothetical protein
MMTPPGPCPASLPTPPTSRPPLLQLYWLRQHGNWLTDWERDLVASLSRRTHPFTDRQCALLRDVVARVLTRGGHHA